MKKNLKKVAAILTAGAMATTLTSAATVQAAEPKECAIGVALYTDAGPAVDAVKAYLDSVSDILNTEFKYTVLTQTDESANLTKIQELISSGVDGIICTMDMGMNAIVQECEAADVYLAGYLCDYDLSYNTAYDQVFKNDHFLGTVADGQCPDESTGGIDMLNSIIEYNKRNVDDPISHVSMAAFPFWAFPMQELIVKQFGEAVAEYNETAEIQITVDPLNEETDILEFSPMNTTYFSKHADTQAIVSFAAGSAFVYPVMVEAGVDKNLKLFTTGYNGKGDFDNFCSNGTQTYQHITVTAVESITYPLVLLLNKLNEAEFADMPGEAERVSSSQFILNSDEDFEKFKKNVFYTADKADCFFTPEEVLAMTAFGNPDATYAQLKDMLAHLTVDDIK